MDSYSLDSVLAIAKGQKGVLWCILGSIAVVILANAVNPLFLLLTILILPFQLHFTFKLATSLAVPVPILWALAMFIPYLSLVLLLVLSGKATKAIQAQGHKVGLMGASLNAIREAMQPDLP